MFSLYVTIANYSFLTFSFLTFSMFTLNSYTIVIFAKWIRLFIYKEQNDDKAVQKIACTLVTSLLHVSGPYAEISKGGF